MKMKLFLFLSLIVGSIGLSVFGSSTTFAAGENYKWINETTIEASGGSYDNKVYTSQQNVGHTTRDVAIKTLRFARVGTTSEFKAVMPSGGLFTTQPGIGQTTSKCGLQLAITINETDTGAGTLRTNDQGKDQCAGTGLTTAVGIGETSNGPAAGTVTPPGEGPADPTPSMCGVDGIGWIICPIANSIADGIHSIFGMVEQLLIFKSYSTDTTNGIYPAWAIMRNFANVAFVVAFMVIIYSQLTSAGITNYGIKKMLPRLIVAAILVNASYWICGLAVDVSNILGASVNDLFASMIPAIRGTKVDVSWQDATLTILSGTAIGGVATYATLAAAGSFGALLWMLVPILLSAVFAILVAIVVLAGRQVILIILIVISPLAFVAYLLPNTSKWFSKWLSTFITLLLMYPIIALIFSGSQLASAIIMSAEDLSMVMLLLALAVQVVPLAITPMVMKLSTGVLGRFAGIVNNPKRGPIDGIKNLAKDRQALATKGGLASKTPNFANRLGQSRENRRRTRELKGKAFDATTDATWQERVAQDAGLTSINDSMTAESSRGAEAQKVQKKNYLGELRDNPQLLSTAAGLGGDASASKILAAVKAEEINETAKAIENVKVTAEFAPGQQGLTEMGKELAAAVQSGDTVKARAMQDMLLTSGGPGIATWRDTMEKVDDRSLTGETMTEMRRDLLSKHGGLKAAAIDVNAFGAKAGTMQDIVDANGNVTGQEIVNLKSIQKNANTYKMSDEELVHQKPSTIELAIKNGGISPAQASRIIGNEELAKFLNDDSLRAKIQGIAGAAPTTQNPTVLNVPHNNPQTGRTSPPPGTSGGSTGSGGLWTP